MSTPAQVTEAHRRLAEKIICSGEEIGKWAVDTAQLIADSEARAVSAVRRHALIVEHERDQLSAERHLLRAAQKISSDTDEATIKEVVALRAEVEKRRNAMVDTVRALGKGQEGLEHEEIAPMVEALRAEVERLNGICTDHYAAHSAASQEMIRLGLSGEVRPGKMLHEALARAEKAERDVEKAKGYIALQVARAETAEREVERLKKIRPVSAFERNPDDPAVGDVYSMEQSNARLLESARDELVNCAKRAEKVEAECAEQQWLKESAIKRSKELTAELAKERARLDWLFSQDARLFSDTAKADHSKTPSGWFLFWGDTPADGSWQKERYDTPRAAIDAGMKEEPK